MSNWWNVIATIGFIGWFVQGVWMLAFPARFRRKRSAGHERAISARLERGKDRYFEELRSLRAYNEPDSLTRIRSLGAASALFAMLALSIRYF